MDRRVFFLSQSNDRLRSLVRIIGLIAMDAVKVCLLWLPGSLVFRNSLLGASHRAFAEEVGSEIAWINDRRRDAKGSDLFRQCFRESRHGKLGGTINPPAWETPE